MPPTKPDFADAGFGQFGCLFVVGGILLGAVVAVALLPFLPTRFPADIGDLVLRLFGIAALAYVVGSLASVVATSVVERAPGLWPRGYAVAFGAGLAGAAVVVPLGVHVRVVGDWAGTAVLLAVAVFLLYILVLTARRGDRSSPRPWR